MSEAHLTPGISAGIQFGHSTASNPWQSDINALKREIADLRTTVQSLSNKIEELERVKAEAVSDVPLHFPSVRRGCF